MTAAGSQFVVCLFVMEKSEFHMVRCQDCVDVDAQRLETVSIVTSILDSLKQLVLLARRQMCLLIAFML